MEGREGGRGRGSRVKEGGREGRREGWWKAGRGGGGGRKGGGRESFPKLPGFFYVSTFSVKPMH